MMIPRTVTQFQIPLLLILVVPAGAAIINVPADQPTIQQAIDAAVSGDEIVVAPGVYTGVDNRDLDMRGLALTVRSTDPNDPAVVASTVIDCQGTALDNQRGFIFHSGEGLDSVVSGLTIMNGYARPEPFLPTQDRRGGAVLCISSSPTIFNCRFIRNNAGIVGTPVVSGISGGGAIAIFNAAPAITECVFLGNTVFGSGSTSGGGAIHVESSTGLALDRCVFAGNMVETNSSHQGGGAFMASGVEISINDCLFSGNFVNVIGGGNRGSGGGGIYISSSTLFTGSAVMCGNKTTISNYFNGGGGGIFSDGDFQLKNSLIVGNGVLVNNCTNCGGGAYDQTSGTGSVQNCTFSGNFVIDNSFASASGAVLGSASSLVNCVLWGDTPSEAIGPSISFSIVEGAYPGIGNFHANPRFVGGPVGSWTDAGFYDDTTYQVVLTDATANWAPGSLAGKFLNPDLSQNLQFYIVDNTATTINIWVDWQTIDTGSSWVPSGAAYEIFDYHIQSISPCIDAGDPLGDYTGQTDIDGQNRVLGVFVDIGADEFNTPASLKADLDGDGDVDPKDFLTFSNCFNSALNPPAPGCANPDADLDADGDVDPKDFLTFSNCFNGALNPPSCP